MSYDFYPLCCVRFQYSRCIVLIQLFWAGFWVQISALVASHICTYRPMVDRIIKKTGLKLIFKPVLYENYLSIITSSLNQHCHCWH